MHLGGAPVAHRLDDVGVARPSGLAVGLRWAGRVVGVRVVEAEDLPTGRARPPLLAQEILRRDQEAPPPLAGLLPVVVHRHDLADDLLALCLRPEQETAN